MEARKDAGTVTAELVLTLPAVLLVVGLAVGAMSIQLERAKLVSVAFDIARAIAREEPMALVDSMVRSLNDQVAFEFLEENGFVCVTLSSEIELLSYESTGLKLIERQCVKAEGQ